jgi:hypothetical protein
MDPSPFGALKDIFSSSCSKKNLYRNLDFFRSVDGRAKDASYRRAAQASEKKTLLENEF